MPSAVSTQRPPRSIVEATPFARRTILCEPPGAASAAGDPDPKFSCRAGFPELFPELPELRWGVERRCRLWCPGGGPPYVTTRQVRGTAGSYPKESGEFAAGSL